MINDLIDEAILENEEKKEKRNYLGASGLGKECSRQLQYQTTNTKKDKPFSARLLRIFEVGHVFEELAIKWIRQAGIELETHDKDGKQFGFSQLGGKLKGHIDGKIFGKSLWECKSMNDARFKEMVKKGIKESHFEYYVQVQIYMAYMGLTKYPATLTAVNKNNCEIKHIEIEFDLAVAQKYADRGIEILKAIENGYTFPREYPNKRFYKCNFCNWQDTCWKGGLK